MSSGNTNRANLPAAMLVFALLMFWQIAAMGMNAAYIMPSPAQVVQRLWDLRGPLTSVIIGASRPQQIIENVQALDAPAFTDEELKRMGYK